LPASILKSIAKVKSLTVPGHDLGRQSSAWSQFAAGSMLTSLD
jgi:hypothetical protein